MLRGLKEGVGVVLKGVDESQILCLLCEKCSIWMERGGLGVCQGWRGSGRGGGGLSQFPEPLLTDH